MKNRKNTFLTYFLLLLSLVYTCVIVINFFMPNSDINIWLSSRLFIAQFLAFPFMFGAIMLVFTAISLGIVKFRKSETILKNIISTIFIITSIIFMLTGVNSPKARKYEDSDTIKIVEWNALNNLTKDSAKKIFKDFDADIAVFPELNPDTSEISIIYNAFNESSIDFNQYDIFAGFGYGDSIAPVTIISKKDKHRLEQEEIKYGVRFGTVKVKNKDIEIIGLHTAPPIPGLMIEWSLDLEIIDEMVKENPNAIVIGDFNANLRHGNMSKLTNHVDVLSSNSILERGTWPQKLPKVLRASIDHILLPKDKYSVKNVEIVDLEGSDHAAIFAEIGVKK